MVSDPDARTRVAELVAGVAGTDAAMQRLMAAETTLARRLHSLQSRDARLGFEEAVQAAF